MKIYANTRNYDIEYFIGKDLWVRVFDTTMKGYYYIKLIDKHLADWDTNTIMVDFHIISARVVDMINKETLNMNDISLVQGLVFNPFIENSGSLGMNYIRDYYVVSKPIDTLSDEEMQEILAEVKRRAL